MIQWGIGPAATSDYPRVVAKGRATPPFSIRRRCGVFRYRCDVSAVSSVGAIRSENLDVAKQFDSAFWEPGR
jgi:hypothetical protein